MKKKIFKILGVVLGIDTEPTDTQVSKSAFPPCFSKIGTRFDLVVCNLTYVSGVIGDDCCLTLCYS